MKKKPTAGRPRSINSKRVQFSLDPQTIADLDSLAKRGARPKSAELRRLVAQEKNRAG